MYAKVDVAYEVVTNESTDPWQCEGTFGAAWAAEGYTMADLTGGAA